MSPESYQQVRPPDPPSPQFLRPVLILDPLRLNRLRTIPRVGEGSALILLEVSSARFARWREGTFPHSNELNAERRSKGYKSEPGLEVKIRPAPADTGGLSADRLKHEHELAGQLETRFRERMRRSCKIRKRVETYPDDALP